MGVRPISQPVLTALDLDGQPIDRLLVGEESQTVEHGRDHADGRGGRAAEPGADRDPRIDA